MRRAGVQTKREGWERSSSGLQTKTRGLGTVPQWLHDMIAQVERERLQGIFSLRARPSSPRQGLTPPAPQPGRRERARRLQIATIARSRDMAVVTRNVRDFADAGIDVIDPWTDA